VSDVEEESRMSAGGSASGVASATETSTGDSERRSAGTVFIVDCAPLTPRVGSAKGLFFVCRESAEGSMSKTCLVSAGLSSEGCDCGPRRLGMCCFSGDSARGVDVEEASRTESALALLCNDDCSGESMEGLRSVGDISVRCVRIPGGGFCNFPLLPFL
jgi:hypothetical protein